MTKTKDQEAQELVDAAKKELDAALVVTKETAIAPLGMVGAFNDEEIRTDKLILPRITVLQGNSELVQIDGYKQGHFGNNITREDYGDTICLIPLKWKFGAVLMRTGEGMVCRSSDGIENMHGEKCAQCPHNCYYKTWTDGGKKKPECAETIDLYALEWNSMLPAVISFKGFAHKPAKAMYSNFMMLKKEAKAIRIGTKMDKNDKGVYFIPMLLELPNLDAERYAEQKSWMSKMSTSKIEIQDANDDING